MARKPLTPEQKERARARSLAWREAHPGLAEARAAAWYEQNKERAIANQRRYYSENREAILAQSASWREPRRAELSAYSIQHAKDNPAMTAARNARRRAAKRQAVPAWSNRDKIKEFYETANGLGMLTGEWHDVDHIVPLQSDIVCGLHCEANLQVLIRKENRMKSNCQWPDMP